MTAEHNIHFYEYHRYGPGFYITSEEYDEDGIEITSRKEGPFATYAAANKKRNEFISQHPQKHAA